MIRRLSQLIVVAALLGTSSSECLAQLRASRLFADGMVIQRGVDVPVWGWAAEGMPVKVEFEGATYPTDAASDGSWSVTLPAMAAGGPYSMIILAGEERIEVNDILVGDVWVASGQSNMEWQVADANNAEAEIAGANDLSIRHFKVPRSWASRPEETLEGGTWKAATPEHVGSFTAVGFFFARELQKHVDVPIGILHTSWGGSRIEPWMSAQALGLHEDSYEELMANERARGEKILQSLRERIGGTLPTEDAGLVDGQAVWADPALDVTDWPDIELPQAWEQAGYEGMDGIGWYRTTFDISASEAEAGMTLALGTIDDSDVTWVNGHEVGRTEGAWQKARVYEVPPSALHAGKNVIAVRVEDTGGGGGMYGDPSLLYLSVGGERRPLAGTWKFKVGEVSVSFDSGKNQIPTLLYNKMIHPLLRFPIKGALWYQGESNAYPEAADEYRDQFKAMIKDWRERWNSGDFPFLWVQLANYMNTDDEPSESAWALLRESQSAALALPNTGQAVAIDVGEADDIHPRNKQDVGLRLALAARKIAYGQDVVHSGPMYTGHTVRDGRMVLAFDHVGGGLQVKGGTLGGFAVAGEDGKFVWADAAVEGDHVVVWSDAVARPAAVRYGWADNPGRANLYNREGLPASPFRTDSW